MGGVIPLDRVYANYGVRYMVKFSTNKKQNSTARIACMFNYMRRTYAARGTVVPRRTMADETANPVIACPSVHAGVTSTLVDV